MYAYGQLGPGGLPKAIRLTKGAGHTWRDLRSGCGKRGASAERKPRHKPTLTGSVGTHVVTFSNGHTVVTQDGIGRADVEEELRQSVVGQVGLAAQPLFLRRPGPEDDLATLFAVKLRRIQAVQEGQGLRQQSVKFRKRLFFMGKNLPIKPLKGLLYVPNSPILAP